MWDYTDEQRLIDESAAKLLERNYQFEDRKGRLEATDPWSHTVWREFSEMGWLGIHLPEDVGGIAQNIEEIAVLMRQFGRHLVVEPFVPTTVLGGHLLMNGAAFHVAQEHLAAIVSGQRQIAVAFSEPSNRFHLDRMATRATSSDGSSFRISGNKSVVLNASSADVIIVATRTSGADGEERGISLFLVRADSPGITMTPYRLNDGTHAADVAFRDVHATNEDLIGRLDEGFEPLDSAVDYACVATAAEAVGAMEVIMEMTTEYLKTREQFGRLIGRNQALQFRMVDMHFALEESRSMVAAAVRALMSSPQSRRALVSAMKVRVGDAARKIGQQGVQLHGAIGMTDEYAVGHYYKRLETLRTLFGDPDHHLGRYGIWSQAANDR